MSAPLCCQVQDARHLHFRLAHNQFYPAHAHFSVSCLKRLRVMVVCTRAFIERNRIKRHGLQSSVYFLFVWMQLMSTWSLTSFTTRTLYESSCGILSCGILSCGILSVGILSVGILSCGILSGYPEIYIISQEQWTINTISVETADYSPVKLTWCVETAVRFNVISVTRGWVGVKFPGKSFT